MITKKTERLTKSLRTACNNIHNKKDNQKEVQSNSDASHINDNNNSLPNSDTSQSNTNQSNWWSAILAIPYGICYGFLSYALLQYAYGLFLNHLIQVIFFVVIPAWTLLIPAIMTGSIYWLIGQYEIHKLFNYFNEQKNTDNDENQEEKNFYKAIALSALGLLIALFIGIEFLEFLPFEFMISAGIVVIASLTHFTVFFNNGYESVEKLFSSDNNSKGNNDSQPILNQTLSYISFITPVLAIISVVFVTGLFHPFVYISFGMGVSAFFVQKLMDYSELSIGRRVYSAFDSTIREYTALLVHCIGEGAIPAAAGAHAGSSFGRFAAQLSGLVATSNEYFTDFHAVAGEKHNFRVFNYPKGNNIYLCAVYEGDKLDLSQSFFFESKSNEINEIKLLAHEHLNDQFNGVFECNREDNFLSVDFKNDNRPLPKTLIEAIFGIQDLALSSNYFATFLTTAMFFSSMVLLANQTITILPFIIINAFVFTIFRAYLRFKNKIIKPMHYNNEDQGCVYDNNNASDDAHDHSHGLDYKPFLNSMMGFSTLFREKVYKRFETAYGYVLSFFKLTLALITLIMVTSFQLSLIHQVLLFPLCFCACIQLVNFSIWLGYSDDKLSDINYSVTYLLDPRTWFNGLIYATIFVVACCIGINGGTEFATHLAVSSTMLPIIIGVFVICALLTEGVWIKDRINQALEPIRKNPEKPVSSDVMQDTQEQSKDSSTNNFFNEIQICLESKDVNELIEELMPHTDKLLLVSI